MQTNSQILELFPTPVYVTSLPDNLGGIVPWFYEQEMLSEEIDAPNYGERSKNSYILNEPQAQDLSTFILVQIKEFATQLGHYHTDFKFGQSWLSYKHPGQHHTMHTHPNSIISGVLYFGEPSESTPAIKFHDTSLGIKGNIMRPKKVKDKREFKYAHETFAIDFQPGLMVLFPSHLHHSVPMNKSNNVRCSLAFNSVPVHGLGEEESLTELLFN